MTKSVIEHVLSRLADLGITDVFGVAGDFAFPIEDASATVTHNAGLVTVTN